MKCIACHEAIDDDSRFCDMCGTALNLCATCKTPVSGKWCTRCGKPAVLAGGAAPVAAAGAPAVAAVPRLRLRNKTLGIDLDVADHSTVGRTTGTYAALFGAHEQVSSRHCTFDYDAARGWCVTDLGSTNKTHYNNKELAANQPQAIGDGTFLKIANIEFFVSIGAGGGAPR